MRRPLLLRTWDALIGRRVDDTPRKPVRLDLLALESRFVFSRPLPQPFLFVGGGSGAPPLVRSYDAETGELQFEKQPFAAGFAGGVRVAAGDLDRDGLPDLIAAAGPGGGPAVTVYSGATGEVLDGPLGSFYAYAPSFTGGVSVASGDVDGDGVADLITAAGAGGAPHVKVWSGRTGELVQSFYAFAPAFRGGATIAAADFTGDGRADLVVGAGAGGGPHVKVFDLSTGQPVNPPLGSFYAFDPSFLGGVDVGTDFLTGDVTGDGHPDLVVGQGAGGVGGSRVRVFDGVTGGVALDFVPFGSGMTAGVRVATAYVDDDGYADVVVGTGAGPTAQVKVFSGRTGVELASPMSPYTPFGSAFTGGLYVGASNDPEAPVVTVTPSATSVAVGGTITLTADVYDGDSSNGVQTPTGGVTFYFGTNTVGTMTLSTVSTGHARAQIVYSSVSVPYTPGNYSAAALYAGDSWFLSDEGVYPDVYVTGGSPPPPPGPPPTPSVLAITGVSDDTGMSATDGLTNDTTLTVFGTATADSEVVVTATDTATGVAASVGSVTASGAGTWSIAYGTTLADGAYLFTASGAAGGDVVDVDRLSEEDTVGDPLTGGFATYLATVDTVAPLVSLAVEPGTAASSRRPPLRVTASDLNGVGTTAALDVDLNNDGDYLDAGETDAETVSLANGTAVFSAYPLLAVAATVKLRARVLDAAGNEGASAAVTRTPTASTWGLTSVTPTVVSHHGGGADDLIDAGNVAVTVPGTSGIDPSECGCLTHEFGFRSLEAAPRSPVGVALRSDNGSLGLPDQILATLLWDGSVAATAAYDPASLPPGEVWQLALAPTTGLTTGRHTFTVDLFIDYPGTADDLATSVSDATFVVNASASPFGAGWAFTDVDTLVPIAASGSDPAGVLRVSGKGGWGFYEDLGGGTFASPSGDAGVLAASGGGYVYTSTDGRTRAFDSGGRMTGWATRDGAERFTFTYDGSDRLSGLAAADGSLATFSYPGSAVVVEGPAGRTTLTLSGGDLVGLATPDGGVRTYTYAGHLLTKAETGVVTTEWTYADGLASSVKSGAAVAKTIIPAASRGLGGPFAGDRSGESVDELGNRTVTGFEGHGKAVWVTAPTGATTLIARDANGWVTGVTDPTGNTTAAVLDAAGRPLTVASPNGGVVMAVYTGTYGDLTTRIDELGRTVTATYDGNGHLLTVTDPLGAVTSYTYAANGLVETATDATGRVVTSVYDAARRLVRTIAGGVSSGTMLYDAAGHAAGWVDALGVTTTVVSDAAGRAVAVTTPDGATTTTVYDPASGLVLGTISASGVATSYQYDGAGRRTVAIEGVGSGIEARTTSVYDDAGRLIAEVAATGLRTTYQYDGAGNVVAVTNPAGHTTRTVYDPSGRAVNRVDALGRVSTTVYDANGNAVGMIDPLGSRTTTVYDAADQVVASVDALGNRTTSVYDAAGRVIATVNALGDRTTTVYDEAGRAVATVDALGNRTTTLYDARGLAVAMTDPLGHRTTSVYDAAGRMVARQDALGNLWTTVYDASGRAVARIDPLGNTSTTVYDSFGRFAASVDALGNVTSAVYDARDRQVGTIDALGHRTTTVLDAAGRTLASVDALGHATSTVYDAFGRAVATVDPLGNRTTTLYDGRALGEELGTDVRPPSDRVVSVDALGHATAWTADALGRTVTTVDAIGNTTTSVYDAAGNAVARIDALGNRTTSVYDALNRAVASVDVLGNRSTSVYDAAGRMIASIDALGNRTTSVYDDAGRMIATIDALGHATTSAYDDAGRRVSTTDALNRVSTTVYDAAGRVVESIDALGNVTTSVYDEAGNAVVVIDALGNRTTTVYDALNRAVAMIDALGNTTTSVYDAAGRMTEAINALGGIATTIYDDAGNPTFRMDPLGRTWATTYDELNRPVTMTDPLDNTTTTVYDANGNAVATVDPLGNRSTTAYDALNREVTVTDALNGVTSYGYDTRGNRTTVTDPVGNVTTSAYDALNREVTRTDPLGQSSTTAYDAVGQVSSTTDRIGRRIDYARDAVGQVATQKWYAVGGALADTLTFTYDDVGNKLTAVAPAGGYTFAYDALWRVVTAAGPGGTLQTFAYDAVGNRVSAQDSFGGTVTTTYDALRRAAYVQQGGTGVTDMLDARGYNAAGDLTTEGRYAWNGSGWATVGLSTFAHDDTGRLAGVTAVDGSAAVLVSYAYEYDAAGRIAAETDNGALRSFGYDATSQVTADGGTGASYSYDANGNRTMGGYATGAGNRTTSDGTWTYTYDAEGNVTAKEAVGDYWEYAYDHRNQMTGAVEKTSPTGSVVLDIAYGYDAFGNVVTRTAGGTTTKSAYDITDAGDGYTVSVHTLWAELDGAGALTTRYLTADGQAVARSTASAAHWLLADRQGSVRTVTDHAGAVAGTITYSAFGEIASETGAAVSGNVLYTGGWYDRATGLYQMHWRSYDPATGQWVSEDPIGFEAGDVNTRRYVRNNSSNSTDVTGLWADLTRDKWAEILNETQRVPKNFPWKDESQYSSALGEQFEDYVRQSLSIEVNTIQFVVGSTKNLVKPDFVGDVRIRFRKDNADVGVPIVVKNGMFLESKMQKGNIVSDDQSRGFIEILAATRDKNPAAKVARVPASLVFFTASQSNLPGPMGDSAGAAGIGLWQAYMEWEKRGDKYFVRVKVPVLKNPKKLLAWVNAGAAGQVFENTEFPPFRSTPGTEVEVTNPREPEPTVLPLPSQNYTYNCDHTRPLIELKASATYLGIL